MFKITDHVVSAEVESELILLDLNSGEYYGLNEMGGLIWKGIEQGHSTEFVANKVAELYSISTDSAIKDIQNYIQELIGLGLIIEK